MPNWCENYLAIAGDASDVKSFIDGIKANPSEGKGMYEDTFSVLDTYAPLKEWTREVAVSYWGTKWSDVIWELPSDQGYESDSSYGYELESLRLETAWTPPVNGIRVVSEKFPQLGFSLCWMETGMCFYGTASFKGGKIIAENYCDNLPDFYEDLDTEDDESWDVGRQKELDFLADLTDVGEELARMAYLNLKETN